MVEDRQESTRFLSPDETISRLQAALEEEEQDGKRLARLVRTVLEDRQWSRFQSVATGVTREHDSFQSFVTKARYAGLGTTLDGLVHMVEPADAELAEEVRMAWKEDIAPVAKHGANQHGRQEDNSNCSPHNESADGILRRLKRDHPDLAQEVIDGTTTATAAARKAGYQTPVIRLGKITTVARKLRDHYTPEEVRELANLLMEEG